MRARYCRTLCFRLPLLLPLGTTGETLECLTKALSGMEHKLNICFNKCDQFSKMHDFARAFGALCWNLSKVFFVSH